MKIRVIYIKLIPLDSFWRRIVLGIVHTVITIPLACDPHPVNIDWLGLSESSLSLAGHPLIEVLLIFFHSFVFFKLNDLLGYLIKSIRLVQNYF